MVGCKMFLGMFKYDTRVAVKWGDEMDSVYVVDVTTADFLDGLACEGRAS